ncbi:DUF7344 domain-containing protein [Halorussus aquaticus]|uniref:Transcriptional regulator n=1 Tax=Halorussus aquaticus TaxID=2953748 RepID=A0ABD5Q460_9EURY|nr:transcriptional regulator [Halorussus aquaticus]
MNYDAPDPDASPELDAAFEVLADAHRRYALYYLRGRESAALDEVATVVAGWLGTRDDPGDMVAPRDRDSVRTALHHVHLPRLAAAGYVSYDADSGAVTPESLPEFVETVLDRSLAQQRDGVEQSDESVFDRHTGR